MKNKYKSKETTLNTTKEITNKLMTLKYSLNLKTMGDVITYLIKEHEKEVRE